MTERTSWRITKLEPVGEWFWGEQIAPEPDIEDYLEKQGESTTLDGTKVPVFGVKKGTSFSKDLAKSYHPHSMKAKCCRCGLLAQLAYIPPEYGRNDISSNNPNDPDLPFLYTFWCWAHWKQEYGRRPSTKT